MFLGYFKKKMIYLVILGASQAIFGRKRFTIRGFLDLVHWKVQGNKASQNPSKYDQ